MNKYFFFNEKFANTFSDLTHSEKMAVANFFTVILVAGGHPQFEAEEFNGCFFEILGSVLKFTPSKVLLDEIMNLDNEKSWSIIRGFSSDKKDTLSIMGLEMCQVAKDFQRKANTFNSICAKTGIRFPFK